MVDQLNNFAQISHSGATAGYRAWLAYYPQKKLTVTLLSNDGSLNVSTAGQQIAEVFLGKKPVINKERKEITLTEAELKRFDGIYRSTRHYDVQKLEYKDGKMIYIDNALLTKEHALHAAHRDTLYLDNTKWIISQPNTIIVQNQGDTLSYHKVSPPDTSAKSLTSLAGDYFSTEADATYTVEVKGTLVSAQIKPFGQEILAPSFYDGFYLEGTLFEFQRDKKGKVTGLLVSTSRAERIPFIRK